MEKEEIIKQIETKYQQLGENPNTYFKGLLHAKPINYWDYTEVDTLLTLQKPRTDFKDEEIFIMYHQVTELVLKMMIHEIKQLVYDPFNDNVWIDKINRLCRYTNMLITSFDVMRSGMNYNDYNTFRATLTPASGFQSAQFRLIEIYATPLINLINEEGRKHLVDNPTIEQLFENIYWKDAGLNKTTGEKTYTLKAFEDRYLQRFVSLAKKVKGKTLSEIISQQTTLSTDLMNKLQEFDHLYNVAWPLVHLQTAQHYLDSKGEQKQATGGSEWKKYLHPKFQQRIFFPSIWNNDDILTFNIKK